jgi:hypothetical protein
MNIGHHQSPVWFVSITVTNGNAVTVQPISKQIALTQALYFRYIFACQFSFVTRQANFLCVQASDIQAQFSTIRLPAKAMAGTKKTAVAADPKKVDKKLEKVEKLGKAEKPEKAEKKPVKADKAGGLKRNMNAYMFFTKDYRAEHAGEGLKVTETARAAGAAWTVLKDKSVSC